MIDQKAISSFIIEIKEDYEKNGKDKPIEVWLLEAIKRHIIGISEKDAVEMKDKLLKGINNYRNLNEVKDEEVKELNEDIELYTNYFTEDLKETKLLLEDNKE